MQNVVATSGDSILWKNLVAKWHIIKDNTGYLLGNGEATKFWRDAWLEPNNLLANLASPILSLEEENHPVSDYVDAEGNWKIRELNILLPDSVINKIRSTPPPSKEDIKDILFWRPNPEGEFTIKHTYQFLFQCDHDSDRIWKLIWNWKGVQRAKVFLWQLAHIAVLTASIIAIWGRGNNPNCMSCDNDIETPFHVIRDCPMSSPVWNCLVKSQNIGMFYNLDLKEWIIANMTMDMGFDDDIEWKDIFVTAVWLIWKFRNEYIHSNINTPLRIKEMKIRSLAREIRDTRRRIENNQYAKPLTVSWKPPQEGWIKLNTDGASRGNPGQASCAGIFRNADSDWVYGYARRLTYAKAIEVEVAAIREGLEIAWKKGFRRIELETDSQAAVNLMENPPKRHPTLTRPIRRIKELLNRNWQVRIRHIYREANQLADGIANLLLNQNREHATWDHPPKETTLILFADRSGVSFPR
ncbi:hypothetical protein Ahy_A06g029039 [Arachis hypogaea]|uniref:RNase H type-1 domain-containing protein n=1 Tax=Arachis hypogaea TaxID=3818 RepID=A0A445CS86_ARAHY|nr:hypothetical protein Ahy_A06g029039 [Arachis hypogaea]